MGQTKLSAKKLALCALFTALTMLATLVIRIPLPLGYVNLGDAFVFLSVFILGPLWGTISAGLGSGLADAIGFISYMPGTLIIKSLMAIVAWLVYQALLETTKKQILSECLAGVVGTIIMAFGYFLYEILLFTTAAASILNAPWNLLQGSVGTIIAIAIMRIIRSTKILDTLQ